MTEVATLRVNSPGTAHITPLNQGSGNEEEPVMFSSDLEMLYRHTLLKMHQNIDVQEMTFP